MSIYIFLGSFFNLPFFSLYVGGYARDHADRHTCRAQSGTLGIPLYHSLPQCFDTGSLAGLDALCYLLLAWMLTILARLVGQGTPSILLLAL